LPRSIFTRYVVCPRMDRFVEARPYEIRRVEGRGRYGTYAVGVALINALGWCDHPKVRTGPQVPLQEHSTRWGVWLLACQNTRHGGVYDVETAEQRWSRPNTPARRRRRRPGLYAMWLQRSLGISFRPPRPASVASRRRQAPRRGARLGFQLKRGAWDSVSHDERATSVQPFSQYIAVNDPTLLSDWRRFVEGGACP
jgi:hypothetical protein